MNINFGPWEPDSASLSSGVLATAKNVYPLKTGYGPIPSLSAISTSALPAKCVGVFFAQVEAGGWVVFAGTRSKLYKFSSGTWVDYTRASGGDYNVPEDDYWSMTQFGSKVIFVNINDEPQVIDVDSGATAFSALGGSPPQARYVTVVGDFVVLACLNTETRKVINSAINNSAGWTVGTDLCDEQEFPDGGRVTGVAGGGESGYVVQERAIRKMNFQAGADIAFTFERVEKERGAAAGYSIASTLNAVFFLSDDGFYKFGIDGLVPIGAQRVNKWFRENSDTARFFSVQAFTDPYAPRICWAFYNSSGSTNFDRLLIYDWQLDRWSYGEIDAQFWGTLVTAGVTLEDLDTYGSIDTDVPYSLDSRVWEGGAPVVGAVNTSGYMAFLEGSAPQPALFSIAPVQLRPGARAFVQSVEPLGIYNDATLAVRVGRTEHSGSAMSYTSSITPSTRTHVARLRASGRLHNFELSVTQSSGTIWTHAQGVFVRQIGDGDA